MQRSSRGGQSVQAVVFLHRDMLGDCVIVIATHGDHRMPADPIDAANRVGAVIDQIANEQADVERFLNRGQRRPVRMDVGQNQDLHMWLFRDLLRRTHIEN